MALDETIEVTTDTEGEFTAYSSMNTFECTLFYVDVTADGYQISGLVGGMAVGRKQFHVPNSVGMGGRGLVGIGREKARDHCLR